jgi:acyl carrier protein phosphodiesterase
MNWLAHLYLSDPDPAFRIGNLLPDLLPGGSLPSLPAEFQPGIAQHLRIDSFTDAHPVFRRSIQRVEPPFRRFAGILTDLFYDHFLSRDWPAYSREPLPDFTQSIYASFDQFGAQLPALACERLELMRVHDWLSSYHDLAGLTLALTRISKRFRRPVELAPAIAVLEQHYDDFQADFRAFFPELQSHVASFS